MMRMKVGNGIPFLKTAQIYAKELFAPYTKKQIILLFFHLHIN